MILDKLPRISEPRLYIVAIGISIYTIVSVLYQFFFDGIINFVISYFKFYSFPGFIFALILILLAGKVIHCAYHKKNNTHKWALVFYSLLVFGHIPFLIFVYMMLGRFFSFHTDELFYFIYSFIKLFVLFYLMRQHILTGLTKTEEDSAPVRFITSCINGHLDEVQWNWAVHDRGKIRCRSNYLPYPSVTTE